MRDDADRALNDCISSLIDWANLAKRAFAPPNQVTVLLYVVQLRPRRVAAYVGSTATQEQRQDFFFSVGKLVHQAGMDCDLAIFQAEFNAPQPVIADLRSGAGLWAQTSEDDFTLIGLAVHRGPNGTITGLGRQRRIPWSRLANHFHSELTPVFEGYKWQAQQGSSIEEHVEATPQEIEMPSVPDPTPEASQAPEVDERPTAKQRNKGSGKDRRTSALAPAD